MAAKEVVEATKVAGATEVAAATEVAGATEVVVATKMVAVAAIMSKTIMGMNTTPKPVNTQKRLQIYQSIQLQYRKTFMLSMKKLPKEQMKRTLHI